MHCANFSIKVLLPLYHRQQHVLMFYFHYNSVRMVFIGSLKNVHQRRMTVAKNDYLNYFLPFQT